MTVLSGHLSSYNTTWDAVDDMHERYWEMNLEIDFLTLKEMAGYLIGIV